MPSSDSDADERPEQTTEDRVREAVEDLIPTVKAVNDLGTALLTGPATVEVILHIEDAATPQEAAEFMVRHIAHVGLDAFTIAVTDQLTGDNYYVKGGKLVTLDEVTQAKGQANEDEQA